MTAHLLDATSQGFAVSRVTSARRTEEVSGRLGGSSLFEVLSLLADGTTSVVSLRFAVVRRQLFAGIVVESFDDTLALALAERIGAAANALTIGMSFATGLLAPDDPLRLPNNPQFASRISLTDDERDGMLAQTFSPFARYFSELDRAVLSLSVHWGPQGPSGDLLIVGDAPTDVGAALFALETSHRGGLNVENALGRTAVTMVGAHRTPKMAVPATLFADVFSIAPRTDEELDCSWSMGDVPASGLEILERVRRAPERGRLLIGKPGSGKSTFAEALIGRDVVDGGRSVLVVDPHGSLADAVEERGASLGLEVRSLDFGSDEPPSLNPITGEPELSDDINREVFMTVIEDVWADQPVLTRGPAFQRGLRLAFNAVRAYAPEPTLTTLRKFIDGDSSTHAAILASARAAGDDELIETLGAEMGNLGRGSNDGSSLSMSGWLGSKLQVLTDDRHTSRIVNGCAAPVEIAPSLDPGAVTVVRLPIGLLGPGPAQMLGELVLARVEALLAHRHGRVRAVTPVAVYVDEWTTLAQPLAYRALAAGRKQGLELTLINQSLRQVTDPALLLGVVGTIVSFSVGGPDARILAEEFTSITADTLRRLPPFMAAVHAYDGDDALGWSPGSLVWGGV